MNSIKRSPWSTICVYFFYSDEGNKGENIFFDNNIGTQYV